MKLYPEKLNQRYDRVKEPYRFIIAAVLLFPGLIFSALPFWWQIGTMFWIGILGILRSAYLCKLEYIPPQTRK